MPLKIRYPFKPYKITQAWGNFNGDYAAHFNDPAFTQHNGVDANVGRTGDITYQTQFPIWCPVEGFRVESVTWDPNGGGNQISMVSLKPIPMGDRTCYARLFLCHAKKILVKVGDVPLLGELIMIGNNTGYSTGPHTHMGLYRIDAAGNKLDSNHATGSTNPATYFSETYAVDEASLATLILSGLRYARYAAGL